MNSSDEHDSTVDLATDVVDAAAAVLGRSGLGGLTLVAVAEELGRSRVTLHRNGVRVEALIAAIVARAAEDLRRSLWAGVVGRGTAAQRLDAALVALCAVVERHRLVLAALYHAPEAPHRTAPGRTTGFDFSEPYERLLLDGVVDGTLQSDAPAEDAELLVNAVTWTYVHLRTAHRWSSARATKRVVAVCSAGFVTPPASRPRART